VITHDRIGTDEDLAREVIVIGRSIAPCIDSFNDDGEPQSDAIAILKRVYADVVARGARSIKGQRIGPATVEYRDVASAFDGDPTRALRALCSAAAPVPGLPVGSFPNERALSNMWPETYS
jgi:hypothetical protein